MRENLAFKEICVRAQPHSDRKFVYYFVRVDAVKRRSQNFAVSVIDDRF